MNLKKEIYHPPINSMDHITHGSKIKFIEKDLSNILGREVILTHSAVVPKLKNALYIYLCDRDYNDPSYAFSTILCSHEYNFYNVIYKELNREYNLDRNIMLIPNINLELNLGEYIKETTHVYDLMHCYLSRDRTSSVPGFGIMKSHDTMVIVCLDELKDNNELYIIEDRFKLYLSKSLEGLIVSTMTNKPKYAIDYSDMYSPIHIKIQNSEHLKYICLNPTIGFNKMITCNINTHSERVKVRKDGSVPISIYVYKNIQLTRHISNGTLNYYDELDWVNDDFLKNNVYHDNNENINKQIINFEFSCAMTLLDLMVNEIRDRYKREEFHNCPNIIIKKGTDYEFYPKNTNKAILFPSLHIKNSRGVFIDVVDGDNMYITFRREAISDDGKLELDLPPWYSIFKNIVIVQIED